MPSLKSGWNQTHIIVLTLLDPDATCFPLKESMPGLPDFGDFNSPFFTKSDPGCDDFIQCPRFEQRRITVTFNTA